MFTVLNDSRKNLTNRGYRYVLIGILAIVMLLTIPQSAVSQPAIITCTPTPTPTPTETVVPYTISYGFRASDRNYGSPNGLSRQTGTLGFSVAVLEKQLSLRIVNQNFNRGTDATNERAVNFGNTTVGATLSLAQLQESVSWQARRTYPSLSFDYEAVLPTGSKSRGLNVGKVDHTFTLIVQKKLGKRLYTGNPDNFARRMSGEVNFGLSVAANRDGGYKKTGNFLVKFNRVLDDITIGKYTYSSEVSFGSLSHKARATARATNSLSIVLDKSGTRLGLGLITGFTKSTPRVAFNASIRFNGAFRIARN